MELFLISKCRLGLCFSPSLRIHPLASGFSAGWPGNIFLLAVAKIPGARPARIEVESAAAEAAATKLMGDFQKHNKRLF